MPLARDPLVRRGRFVFGVRFAIETGGGSLAEVPEKILELLTNGEWREYYFIRDEKTLVRFTRFAEFVTAKEGLATDLKTLRRLCTDRRDVLDLLDQATVNREGKRGKDTVSNINGIRPSGTSQAAALRRLRTARPDLHADVIARKLSPHAAMVQAGFRTHTITVPRDPEKAARALLRAFSLDDVFQVILTLSAALAEEPRWRGAASSLASPGTQND